MIAANTLDILACELESVSLNLGLEIIKLDSS